MKSNIVHLDPPEILLEVWINFDGSVSIARNQEWTEGP